MTENNPFKYRYSREAVVASEAAEAKVDIPVGPCSAVFSRDERNIERDIVV